MKHIVEYTLPYEHRVQVGIEANDAEAAVTRAQSLFDAGDIWDDTLDVPLLYDDYEETGDAGVPLQFTVVDVVEDNGEWPALASCVTAIRQRDAAFAAARLLVDVYQRIAKRGGAVELCDLDDAYDKAVNAITTGGTPS